MWLLVVLVLVGAAEALADPVILEVPDYHWYYGCSPTSAGMIMGWYDRNGYQGLHYPDLVPGGVAGFSTHVREWYEFEWSANADTLASKTIASDGHIQDFWGTDKPSSRPYDCLADFMGTSNDSYGNGNGSTKMDDKGTSGIGDYVRYCGYDVVSLQRRTVDVYGGDFTFADYRAEIDAGRPVLLSARTDGGDGHSMVGYGYEEVGGRGKIFLHDTWEPGRHAMWWDGTYDTKSFLGMTEKKQYRLQKVTTLEIGGGVTTYGTLEMTPSDDTVLEFGYVLVGHSANRKVVVTNRTGLIVAGTWMPLTDSGGGVFSNPVPLPVPILLVQGSSQSKQYDFAPNRRGHCGTGSVVVAAELSGDIFRLTLSGTGVAPVAYVDDAGADLGRVRLGLGGTLTLAVGNGGDGNLSGLGETSNLRGTVSGVSGGGFAGPGGSFSLADYQGCSFAYDYAVTERGRHEAVVQWQFENGGNGNAAHTRVTTLAYTAVGPACEPDVAPNSEIDFGEMDLGHCGSVFLTLTNLTQDEDGGDCTLTDLRILGVVLCGDDPEMFSVPHFLAPRPNGVLVHKGELWEMELCFLPRLGVGEKCATLAILTDEGAACGQPGRWFTYTLTGSGVPEPHTAATLLTVVGLLLRRRAGGR